MAFPREAGVQPSAIGDISVELFDPKPDSTESAAAWVSIQVQMDDGSVRVRRINLANHLGAQTIQNLRDFMAMIRTRANSEILPPADNPGTGVPSA